MPEFDDIREQLSRAREEREGAQQRLAQARDRLKRLAQRERELDRSFNNDDGAQREERARLRAERERAEADLKGVRDELGRVKSAETIVSGAFAEFTDPTKAIARFNDNTPILLLPLRLETRFKTLPADDNRAAVNELWVRIFPDTCWIDSFDPALTVAEIKDAKSYWIGIWKAGGFEEQERGAWSLLATDHSSGRARWIISQFVPVNLAAKPAKPRAQDVILTIATETPLAGAEETPVATFWRAVWLADGDNAGITAAQNALRAALGAARADEIIAQFQPVNFTDALPEGVTKNDVNVSVATVVFPVLEGKQSSWAQAPRIDILPDRFVFIGYEGGNTPSVVVVGKPVPPVLIAGPDPGATKDDQIQPDGSGDLLVPDDMKWMTDFDRAVDAGMGLKIDLNATQAQQGFSRVLVVGLRVNADQQKAKSELETLFRHHFFSRTGFAVVPQGTPTNNTEAVSSGFDRFEDPDSSFDENKNPQFTPTANWLDKRDGQWLAEYLGIDQSVFERVHHAGGTDQAAARDEFRFVARDAGLLDGVDDVRRFHS